MTSLSPSLRTPLLCAAILAAGTLLPASAGDKPPGEHEEAARVRRWINAGAPAGGLVVNGVEVEAPWRPTEEIRAFARASTRGSFTITQKVRALKEAILGLRRLNLRYDPNGSLTATEAFATRSGNCLGFTNLFIAMAREVGVDAFYVDVSDVDEFVRHGEFVVNNRHVCAGYWGPSGFGILDFVERPPFAPSYRPVTDLVALAHFYNNRGTDRLRNGDYPGAEQLLRVSLAVRPDFAWARNNLGVVLGRLDRLDQAEEQYRRAAHDDTDYPPAYSNLASLLVLQGRDREAGEVFDTLSRVRNKDPYSQYQAGLFALGHGDFEKALKRLHRSASLDPELPEVQVGLGEAYLAAGNPDSARHAFERALKLQPDNLQASLGLERAARPTHSAPIPAHAAPDPPSPAPVPD